MKLVQNILVTFSVILAIGGARATAEIMSGGNPNPSESSLKVWVRADAGVKDSGGNEADIGEAVASWEDSSDADTDFTGSSDPTLQNATIGGTTVRVIDFDGTNDYFDAGDVQVHSNTNGMTIFIVSKFDDNPATESQWLASKHDSSPVVTADDKREWGVQLRTSSVCEEPTAWGPRRVLHVRCRPGHVVHPHQRVVARQ